MLSQKQLRGLIISPLIFPVLEFIGAHFINDSLTIRSILIYCLKVLQLLLLDSLFGYQYLDSHAPISNSSCGRNGTSVILLYYRGHFQVICYNQSVSVSDLIKVFFVNLANCNISWDSTKKKHLKIAAENIENKVLYAGFINEKIFSYLLIPIRFFLS